ncbi:MAG: cyclic pyranopterin monophosphate synthase MoaC [Clostridiales bacterium]|jgi:molybdenum cofactor biosynthesis protein MoaC|nr:cyclic pyranopterin monophosphate synthase MoaC [Clostridiales bacterium]
MKKIPVEEAVGLPFLHDLTMVKDGKKEARFKRGEIVQPSDVPILKDMGKLSLYAGELPEGQLHEEDAARLMAEILLGENMALSGPSEGKLTLSADVDGLFLVDSDALLAINSAGDYTVACLEGFSKVKKGDALAGVRIIPLFTPKCSAEKALDIARQHSPVLSLKPYKKLKVGIVLTGSELLSGRIKDLFEPKLKAKIEEFGGIPIGCLASGDGVESIAQAARFFLGQGAGLVLLAGGMSVDPDDSTPAAMKAVCGELAFSGIPVQPGNMLALGYKENAALIGVPGASLIHAKTSLDFFLPMIFAGVPATRQIALRLGEGGLLPDKKPEIKKSLSHFTNAGEARMVDVSGKSDTEREAVAQGQVFLDSQTFALLAENRLGKGDALGVARIAGIMAAKKASELVPLCHPVPLSKIEVSFSLDPESLTVTAIATAKSFGPTGVEMEALQAVSSAALAIYDMCKSSQKDIVLGNIRVVKKTGGKSGDYEI